MRETCACGATIEAKHGSDLTFFRLDHKHVEPPMPRFPALVVRGPRFPALIKGGHMPRRLRRWQR